MGPHPALTGGTNFLAAGGSDKYNEPVVEVTLADRVVSDEGGTGRYMSNDKAAEAREGLLGSVTGKAKEVVGAVSGKDDLVEEGQLQQVEARNRKDAIAGEAIADAKRREAGQELRDSSREAAEQKGAAHADAAREKSDVQRQRDHEHAVAARDAELQEAEGRKAAEAHADEVVDSELRDAEAIAADANATEQKAAAEKLRLEREAAVAEQQAAKLRAQTKN